MTARQRLDHVVLSLTGTDIRLIGNWDQLPDIDKYALELSEALSIPASRLRSCKDILDLLQLIEGTKPTCPSDDEPSLF